jgi:hypothetical protein
MDNTRRSVFLAVSIALVLPGCAPESGIDDLEGMDTETVESLDQQTSSSEGGSSADALDDAAIRDDSAEATLTGCSVFPANNWWNTDISSAPVDAKSSTYVATIGAGTSLHPDFGTQYGIP